MATNELEILNREIIELKRMVSLLSRELRTVRDVSKPMNGVMVKASDVMNGFQSALAKSINSTKSAESGENIQDYIVKDLDVEFTAPLVAENESDEPMLMLPNMKSVSDNSPAVRLKFSVVYVPPKE